MRTTTIDPEVQDVIDRSTVIGNTLLLPEQLERRRYKAVDKVLKGLGGKWDRKDGGHVFPFDPATLIKRAAEEGTYVDRKQALGFFETPDDLARDMVGRARITKDDIVLEPSAGHGRIVRELLAAGAAVVAVEIDENNASVLGSTFADEIDTGDVLVRHGDFLAWAAASNLRFAAVVMNPPFADGQDMAHIRAAWRLLQPGGRLVAICSEGPFFRSTRAATAFRKWLDEIDADTSPLPAGTFSESGTNVKARMIEARKPAG